jgi:hypothetical protein
MNRARSRRRRYARPALENPPELALIRIKAVISLQEYAKIMLNRLCGECDE